MLLDDIVGLCAFARSMFDVYNAAMQNTELEEEEIIGERRNKSRNLWKSSCYAPVIRAPLMAVNAQIVCETSV